jgi:hypothetical protein
MLRVTSEIDKGKHVCDKKHLAGANLPHDLNDTDCRRSNFPNSLNVRATAKKNPVIFFG